MTAGFSEEIREMEVERDAGVCFGVMRVLRPHLVSEGEFMERWVRQRAAGYRVMGLWNEGRLVALAGFRVMETLVHGVHLYVDDLVTVEGVRSRGYGGRLLGRVREEARALGCAKVLLDTPLANVLGHRFYYRQGLLATALRFSELLGEAS